jgi:hypothetical protein
MFCGFGRMREEVFRLKKEKKLFQGNILKYKPYLPFEGMITHKSVTTNSLHGISTFARRKVKKVLADELFTLAIRLPGVSVTISASDMILSAPSYITPDKKYLYVVYLLYHDTEVVFTYQYQQAPVDLCHGENK